MRSLENVVHILGAGPAGLTAAYAATQENKPFTLYEASSTPGGNARTFRLGDCLYDTGAHRFHDKDQQATALVKDLLGNDLSPVDAPSVIYHKQRFLDFPLHLQNIVKTLPLTESLQIGLSFLNARLNFGASINSFSTQSISRYGRKLSEMFLLNYSEKLWGLNPDQLSPSVSGGRLKGLTLWSLIRDSFGQEKKKTNHLDGRFFYPQYGIGMIADRFVDELPQTQIRYNSRITGLNHNGKRITEIEVNKDELITVNEVVSTLPITVLLRGLSPSPPESIMQICQSLRFRHLLLVPIVIARECLTRNASIYFPDKSIPFTRLYESKNRSSSMAPTAQTCIVLELPCFVEDPIWNESNNRLIRLAKELLQDLFGVDEDEILATDIQRIPFAYPLLEMGIEKKLDAMTNYLSTFENLHLLGRSSTFTYTHIHDLIIAGLQTIKQLPT